MRLFLFKSIPIFFVLFLPTLSFFTDCAFCETKDQRDSANPFGVLDFLPWDHAWNRHYYNPDKIQKAAKLMKEAGVGFVRMDFLWSDIEPKRGIFDFKKYDQITDILTRNDIKILGILQYNPGWDNKPWNAPPNPIDYTRYAKAVVSHFKDRVKYWEIWNEPDTVVYWDPQDDGKSYCALLQAVYPEMKKADPACKVVMGSTTKYIPFLLRRIYQNGVEDSFDIVNVHPFTNPLRPGAVQTLKGMYRSVYKLMEKNNDTSKPIWFTELGAPGVKNPDTSNAWWEGVSPTEEQQAEWVTKVYDQPLRWKGVERIFWAFFRDTPGHFKNGIDYFGLVREDFSKKPSYLAYQQAHARWLREKGPASKDNS